MLSRSEPSPVDERTFNASALGDAHRQVGSGGGWVAGGGATG